MRYVPVQINDSEPAEWGVADAFLDGPNIVCRGCTLENAQMIANALNAQ